MRQSGLAPIGTPTTTAGVHDKWHRRFFRCEPTSLRLAFEYGSDRPVHFKLESRPAARPTKRLIAWRLKNSHSECSGGRGVHFDFVSELQKNNASSRCRGQKNCAMQEVFQSDPRHG